MFISLDGYRKKVLSENDVESVTEGKKNGAKTKLNLLKILLSTYLKIATKKKL